MTNYKMDQAADCPVCKLRSTTCGQMLSGYRVYACPNCSLRFTPEAFDCCLNYDAGHRTKEYIENQVDRLRVVSKNIKLVEEHATYRPFFDHFEPRCGNRLLDVGCGVASSALQRGLEVGT